MLDIIFKLKNHNPWISDRILFLTLHGSRAYGTNVEGSDEDFKGICVAPKEYYLGFSKNFEQQELSDPDAVIYNINKFFTLAAANNPNIIECLYTDPSDHILVSKLGEKILSARDKFLSKRIRYTFAGYARSELKKLNDHRRYLLSPPKIKPTREDCNLNKNPEIPTEQLAAIKSEISKNIEKYIFSSFQGFRDDQIILIQNSMFVILTELKISKDDLFVSAARQAGITDNFIEYLRKEREYDSKKKDWEKYQAWLRNRNPKRATLEAKFGYDCKHAYHLVRLLRECAEVLETGVLLVKRPDAKELLDIRNGAWTYDFLMEYVELRNKELDIICAKSKLQDTPDMRFIDNLCVEIIEASI